MKKILLNCFLLLMPLFVISQNFTSWTGSGNWSNSGNWNNGTSYGQLQFTNGGSSSVTADAAMSQWRLFFNNGVSYTISGSGALSLFDFGGSPSWVLSDASVNQNLNFPLNFADSGARYAWITTRAAGPLTFGGDVNVTGGSITALRIAGTNTAGTITLNGLLTGSRPLHIGKDNVDANQPNTRVFLNGNNTSFSGTTTLYAGVLTIPANSALGSGGLIIGNGAVANTLAVTGNTSRSQNITVTNASSAAVIDVSSSFTLTGALQQTGTNQATKFGKSGAGTLTLSGTSTYQGQIKIGQGSVILTNSAGLGTNTSTINRGVDLGLNVANVSQANNVTLLAANNVNVGQSIYVAPNTGGAIRALGMNGAGQATFANEIYLGGDLIVDPGLGTILLNGVVTNTGSLISNSGTVALRASNTYTGSTIVRGGTLRLDQANRIADVSPMVFAGGTFSTGAATGFSDTVGTMMLNASTASTLALGSGNHTLTFANSSALNWGAGGTLTITGWAGTAGQSNTSGGKIIVGTGGLTLAQRSQISFAGYSGTPIIVGGELVPPGPGLAVTAGALDHGLMCVGAPASLITYTITNTGATATGVTVVSNNPEFAVLNAPTTVNAGSTATYDVLFTPSAAGTRSATITISTTTANSNTPVTSNLTGTGVALPTATVSGTTTVCRNAAAPSITFTGANGLAPYTFTYSINGGGAQTVTTTVGNSVTVSVPTATAGIYTYDLSSVLSANACNNLQSGSASVTVDAGTTYYADTDNDGFGDPANPVVSCTGQPALTATNNTDCAPEDATKWRTGSFYVDADNDGYYNGNPEAITLCYGAANPSGYTSSIIGTDCDDANAEINPNHVEVAGNGIDDNCDGAIDEVGPAISLIPTQCGATLSNIAATIYSQQAAGAQGYRFEVSNGPNVRTYDSATNSFSLLNLPGGVTYGTTYTIRVAVKTNGFWRSYSSPCTITTPAMPATTNVIASQCGITLANIANLIYCNQVTAANQYRFEVTDTATSNVRTFDSSLNRFSLTSLVGGASYDATYSIRVALRFGATWEDYGAACNVSTPATPGVTNLVASQCGITISSRWTTLYANQVPDAQGYRFEVSDGVSTRFVDRAVSNFALGQVSGGVSANTVYTIRVAVLYNSVYGNFGPACTVTASAGFSRTAAAPLAVFDVKTYPNPFAENFKLDINTSGEESVSVKVYDMIGKLVESKEISVSELGTQELGHLFPSGVYNVIVSQGENMKTLRVVKR